MDVTQISSAASAAAAQGAQPASGAPTGTQLASEETFLKLLVAQMKNQDPMKPQDGTEFLGQLAQFSQLEQLIAIRQQLSTLGTATPATPTPATGSGSQSNGSVSGQ